jgi:hypothetical protein
MAAGMAAGVRGTRRKGATAGGALGGSCRLFLPREGALRAAGLHAGGFVLLGLRKKLQRTKEPTCEVSLRLVEPLPRRKGSRSWTAGLDPSPRFLTTACQEQWVQALTLTPHAATLADLRRRETQKID